MSVSFVLVFVKMVLKLTSLMCMFPPQIGKVVLLLAVIEFMMLVSSVPAADDLLMMMISALSGFLFRFWVEFRFDVVRIQGRMDIIWLMAKRDD